MRKILIAAVIPLAGCSAIVGSTSADAIACTAALVMTGASDPGALALAALQTPSCQSLAKDILDSIINSTVKTNVAAAARQSAIRGYHR